MKIKEKCQRLVTYIIEHYYFGLSSGEAAGHRTLPFGSKADKYSLGVNTFCTLEEKLLTLQTCNSHRKFVALSSLRVLSLKDQGLAVS